MSGVFSSWLTERRKFRSASCALLELRGELVERDGERRDLGGSLDRDGLGMRAARERARGGRDPVDRPRDAAREEEGGERGEEPAGGRGDEQPPDVRRQERCGAPAAEG